MLRTVESLQGREEHRRTTIGLPPLKGLRFILSSQPSVKTLGNFKRNRTLNTSSRAMRSCAWLFYNRDWRTRLTFSSKRFAGFILVLALSNACDRMQTETQSQRGPLKKIWEEF